jgi:hypothetical protein
LLERDFGDGAAWSRYRRTSLDENDLNGEKVSAFEHQRGQRGGGCCALDETPGGEINEKFHAALLAARVSNALARSESGREGFQFGALGFDAGVEFGLVGGPVESLAEKEVFVGDFDFLEEVFRPGEFAIRQDKRGEIAHPALDALGGRVPVVHADRLTDVGVFAGGDHAVGEVTTSWSAAL